MSFLEEKDKDTIRNIFKLVRELDFSNPFCAEILFPQEQSSNMI